MTGFRDVLLIERGDVGKEASFAAAGIIAPQVEADGPDDFFQLASASRDLYPTFVAALLEETGVDVEFEPRGTLYLAFTEADEEDLHKRFNWQKHAGLSVEQVTRNEAVALEPTISRDVRAAMRFPLDTQVENRKLVEALASSCKRFGVEFLTGTTVESLRCVSGKIEGVESSSGFVASATVIVAGGAWTSLIAGLPAIPIVPVRGQMLCFRSEPKALNHIIYSPRGYVVPRRDGRLLAGSTLEEAGYNKVVTHAGLKAIRSLVGEISPQAHHFPLIDSWAGLRPRAADNLPVIGPCGEIEGLTYATGHYRNGILLAPITGQLVATTIVEGVLPPLLTAFTPDRFKPVQATQAAPRE
jgi:glycine oxidase